MVLVFGLGTVLCGGLYPNPSPNPNPNPNPILVFLTLGVIFFIVLTPPLNPNPDPN